MPTFEDREKDFENRFKHEQELRFKITVRRNRMLGLWAAERMGLRGAAADDYAKTIVAAQIGKGGDRRVIDTVVADLAAKGDAVTDAQVKFELDHFAAAAEKQVMSE